MDDSFFEHPILNSPYAYPGRHWELDGDGQPTGRIVEARRGAKFITPIPRPKKHKGAKGQGRLVCQWRAIGNPSHWGVTPETARLLQHWRTHKFESIRRTSAPARASSMTWPTPTTTPTPSCCGWR